MTPDEIELGIRAAKLFTPKPWKHTWNNEAGNSGTGCIKCNARWYDEWKKETPCEHPDPIDINWDNAMRLRDKCNTAFFCAAMRGIWQKNESYGKFRFTHWVMFLATPADYISAACTTREGE